MAVAPLGSYDAVMNETDQTDDPEDAEDTDERLTQPVRVVPELVRQRVLHLGQQGKRWLADLPGVVAHLERAWSITVGQALTGGTGSYVAPARTAGGGDAILKIAIPEVGFADELRVLESAQGHGYVRLLASDREREALLLEALGPPMASLALPPEQQITLLCQMLRQAWQAPRPAGLVVTPNEEKAGQLFRLVNRLWEELDHPCSEQVVQEALRYAERRASAFDLECCVVVHGDPHPWNALQALAPRVGAEAGFIFVDPVGFLADPAYDLGVVLRDWCAQLLATGTAGAAAALVRRYCALLSAETGVEETAIWEWGFLERVSSGLYCLELGIEELGRPLLQTAEMLI
ncbi:MAG TPA: aminoglycoside phosphotransferase family protein [Ktedonobacterales bacterium]|nr:aminoglycoside phosphotransferase family protein [Ktedonobacterales bacterium]